MSTWQAYRDDIVFSFRKQKQTAEKAVQQLQSDELFFRQPGEFSNSVAIIIKHVAGNLLSRWTDFLTTDGDKPWRDRDAEFVIGPADTRAALMEKWEQGWNALLQTLVDLTEADWLKTITIRGEPHSVLQAIHRSLTHTTYHVGQIVFLCRLLKTDDWTWITIPPGKSKEWSAQGKPYLK
jgi:uncharacterized damage-inducible protein DinB